jgi:heme/copper-type cytochrome/quinol oxidase subunit 2
LLALAVAACLYVNLGMAAPQREQPEFWVLLAAMVVATTALSYVWQFVYARELQGETR